MIELFVLGVPRVVRPRAARRNRPARGPVVKAVVWLVLLPLRLLAWLFALPFLLIGGVVTLVVGLALLPILAIVWRSGSSAPSSRCSRRSCRSVHRLVVWLIVKAGSRPVPVRS